MFLIWPTSKRDKGKTETGEGQKMGERKKIKNRKFQYKAARELGQGILSVLAFALVAKY
jgi:hypothetical protein